MKNIEKSEIVNLDLKQLVYDITKYGWDGPVEDDMLKAIEELKSLRSENETIKKDFKALFEGRVNDYNNRIADLEDQIYKLEKVAEASEDYLLNHESAETCFSCDSDMTHYDRVELALKEWEGKNGK